MMIKHPVTKKLCLESLRVVPTNNTRDYADISRDMQVRSSSAINELYVKILAKLCDINPGIDRCPSTLFHIISRGCLKITRLENAIQLNLKVYKRASLLSDLFIHQNECFIFIT